MANEYSPDDAIELWQSQHVEPMIMSMEEIRNRALQFERQIRTRNRRETVVGVVTIAIFGCLWFWFPNSLERAGSLLAIAGILFVILRMNGMAAPDRVPGEGGFQSCLTFHRRELERQRDLLRRIWLWYLAPLVPGVVAFDLGVIAPKVRPDHPADWWRVVPSVVIALAWFWFTIRLNNRAAAKLQQAIDELDRIAEP